MKKNKILPILFLGILASTNGFAQNNNPRKTYDDFKKQALQKYNDFRTQANEQYAVFLKQAWEQYNALPAIPKPKDETVPPVTIPEEDKDKTIKSNPIPIKEVVVPPTPDPQPTPIAPIKENSQPQERTIDFVYCGTQCRIRLIKNLNLTLQNCSNEQLSNVWTQLSAEGVLNNTIRDCLAIRVGRNLCDWAYLNLLSSFSKAIYGNSNEATMLTSYIYAQSGYKMRLGRNEQNIYLLYASEHGIYDIAYFDIDGLKFYPFECNKDQLEICDASLPKEKPLSLYIPQNQQFEYKASKLRTLTS